MSELDAYHYELPRELIAQQPLAQRADARLLVVDRSGGTLHHAHVRDLPELLAPGDALVLNDTRVVPARLVGHRTQTGGRWEGLFLRVDEEGHWRLLSKTRGKLAAWETVTLQDDHARGELKLRMIEKLSDGQWIAHPESDEDALTILNRVGRVPLPPYIRQGEMVAADRDRYQTVYAQQPGAVAAPTAGLHFTEPLLANLQAKGVGVSQLTLHVGWGTFQPMGAASLDEHKMHEEWGEINAETVEQINARRAAGGRIISVGTTSVRVLESAAAGGELQPWSGHTDLFIRPPYEFRAVDALLTNFHLPKTTLLVLVRTFGGDALIRHAYQEAIAEEYRFYSYGDAMLIL
jgi:S-adenosylmethionine:tRNA ribosyltransferase-isomerase